MSVCGQNGEQADHLEDQVDDAQLTISLWGRFRIACQNWSLYRQLVGFRRIGLRPVQGKTVKLANRRQMVMQFDQKVARS